MVKFCSKSVKHYDSLRNFTTFNVKEILINSDSMWNFNNCFLVWMFSSAKLLNGIEILQKRALKFLLPHWESVCGKILNKPVRSSVSINKLKTLCVEIYKNLINWTQVSWKIFLLWKKQIGLPENNTNQIWTPLNTIRWLLATRAYLTSDRNLRVNFLIILNQAKA